MTGAAVAIIIPALDEEEAIGSVLRAIPFPPDRAIVVDNGSRDRTAERARTEGAQVVSEPRRGYGRACLAGLRAAPTADIIVFLDADFSDDPADMPRLVDPIANGEADLVLGARVGPGRPWHARLGTQLYVSLINWLWGCHFRDLGPFRAIRRTSLEALEMTDVTWGWTIEMQVKAVEAGLRYREVTVPYRDRIGSSKISGTVSGSLRAGSRMLATILGLWSRRRR